VRSRRKRMGFSQEELAGRAGLHRTYVADIERGARNLSLANIEKLAKALDTTIPVLFSQGEAPGRLVSSEHLPEILLVEDNAADVELTLTAFKRACVRNPVQVIRDGAEALDYLFSSGPHKHRKLDNLPQVMLLDLNLPKVSGLEVLRRLKADVRTRSIRVAVLSGSERGRDVEESKALGAEAYIVKPVDFHRFTAVTPILQLCWALLEGKSTA